MSDIKRNINLVCLFKGTDNYLSSLEPGGYVDTMLKEPYSLATAYLKAYADKDISIRHKYNINLLNLKDDGKGLTDSVRFQNEFLGKILYNNPFAIGFSTYCWNIDTTITLIQKIKKIRPKTIIILGGRYALNEYLYKYPEIDFVIRGEGEIPFSDLVKKNFSKNEITPGISYIKDKILLDGGEGHIVKDIDTIPSPYTTGLIKPNIYNMMIELSRGCLNNCGYCEWNSNRTLRIHSEKRIREEILFAIRNRLRHITIIDSAINYNKILLQSLLRICKEFDTDSPLFSYNLRYCLLYTSDAAD
ncbi:MAG: cobalamin-dependent protein, partial [Deltaproteobacteria bacterium]|nr:cobalamin-dependent protein [Deltaproteobacteria bacterium]